MSEGPRLREFRGREESAPPEQVAPILAGVGRLGAVGGAGGRTWVVLGSSRDPCGPPVLLDASSVTASTPSLWVRDCPLQLQIMGLPSSSSCGNGALPGEW